MNSKKATYIVLAGLMFIGIGGYINITNKLNNSSFKGGDFALFPQILCVAIVILSILSLIETMRKEEKNIPLANLKLIGGVTIATLAYIYAWSKFRIFYPASIVYVIVMFWLCSKSLKDYNRLLKVGTLVSLGTVLVIYLFFGKAMQIRF